MPSHPLMPATIDGIPDRASPDRWQWNDSYRHLKGCWLQAQAEHPRITPIPNFDAWAARVFRDAGGNMHAMKHVKGFTKDDFLAAWKAKLSSASGALWSGTWIENARTERKVVTMRQQEQEAVQKRIAERIEAKAMPEPVATMVGEIGLTDDETRRDAGWKDVDDVEREAMIEASRGQGTFRLSWSIGERIAKAQWWSDTKGKK